MVKHNNKVKVFFFIIIVTFFTSCFNDKFLPQQVVFSSFYYNGIPEFCYVDDICMIMENHHKQLSIDDTIYIDSLLVKEIKEGIINIRERGEFSQPFDPVLFVQMDSIYICVSFYDNSICMIKKGSSPYSIGLLDKRLAYLLKWKSGYYNCLSLEDLECDSAILFYGIPKDYNPYPINPIIKKKEKYKVVTIMK